MKDNNGAEEDRVTNEEDIRESKLTESNEEGTIPSLPSNYKVLPDFSEETDPDDSTVVGQHIYSLQNDTGETFDVFETLNVGFIGRYRDTNRNEQWVHILEKHSPIGALQWWKDAGYETEYENEEAIHRLWSDIPHYPINSRHDPTTEQYVVNELDVTMLPHHLELYMIYWEQIITSTGIKGDQVIVYKNHYNEIVMHVKQKSPELASTWHTLNGFDPHNEDDLDELEATLNHFMSDVEVNR